MFQHIFDRSIKSTKQSIFCTICLILTQHPWLLTYNNWMHTKWEQLNDTLTQGSVVSIVTRIWARQFRVRVQAGANNSSLLQNIQPGCGANPPFNGCGTEQWRTEGGIGAFNTPTPQKFRSFDKAEPNSQFRGKYTRNNLTRIRLSLIFWVVSWKALPTSYDPHSGIFFSPRHDMT
jgi:hypothetical protein